MILQYLTKPTDVIYLQPNVNATLMTIVNCTELGPSEFENICTYKP